MKKAVCIVDDIEDEYLELKNILEKNYGSDSKKSDWKDSITVINPYFSHRPYEPAKNFIIKHKPQILFIDYDLKIGKTGDMLFREVNTYECYAIFLSRFHEEADVAAQYANATFLNKHIDPIVRPDRLESALTLAFKHFEKDKEVTLKLHDEKTGNVFDKAIKCEDILLFEGIPGEAEKFKIQYLNRGILITTTGPSRGGVGPVAEKLKAASNCFVIHRKHPYLVYNKWRFSFNESIGKFQSETISSQQIAFDRKLSQAKK